VLVRPGKAGPKGGSDAIASEIRFVVRRVKTPPEKARPEPLGSEPCDGPGDGTGDA
jgi:hypothetical protein